MYITHINVVKESSIDLTYTYKCGLPKSAGVFIFCLYFREHPPTYLKSEKRHLLLRPNHEFIMGRCTLHKICNFDILSEEFLLKQAMSVRQYMLLRICIQLVVFYLQSSQVHCKIKVEVLLRSVLKWNNNNKCLGNWHNLYMVLQVKKRRENKKGIFFFFSVTEWKGNQASFPC